MNRDSNPSSVGMNCWWRFAKYRIRAGLIEPDSDEVLEFDPWAEARQAGTDFLELMEGPGDPESVLAWCSSYGLLGLLPQMARHIQLADQIRELPFQNSLRLGNNVTVRPLELPMTVEFIPRPGSWMRRSALAASAQGLSLILASHSRISTPIALWKNHSPRPGPHFFLPSRRTRSSAMSFPSFVAVSSGRSTANR
jgi:hypothetical protein